MTNRTAAEWLQIPEDKLGVKLAEVLTPGPWKHGACMGPVAKCTKCGEVYWDNGKFVGKGKSCSVPDPITIDWNTAMAWFRKAKPLASVLRSLCGPSWISETNWMLTEAQPKHYLIAAAMEEGSRA